MRLERMHPGRDAHVVDVPVVVRENTVLSVHGRVQEDVESLVLRRGARDLVRVDDEVEGSEPLGHAEEFLTRLVHRPLVRWMKRRHHLLEHRLEALPREGPDQALRVHHLAGPGIVDVDEIPNRGLAGAQSIDRIRVRGEAFGADLGVELAAERIEHVVGVVAFPAVDVELLVTGPVRQSRQRSDSGGGRRPEPGLLQKISSVQSVLEHDRSPLKVVLSLPVRVRLPPILPAGGRSPRRPARRSRRAVAVRRG